MNTLKTEITETSRKLIDDVTVASLTKMADAKSQVALRAVNWRSLRLAYLTTQYPKVSHTFIRREICELERRGHTVLRLAIRPPDSAVVDPADEAEALRTQHCLKQSKFGHFWRIFRTVALRPAQFVRTCWIALNEGRRSERGLLRHLAYVVEATWLVRVLSMKKIEHLHVHFATNAAVVARYAYYLGGPRFSVTVHGPDEFDAPRSWQLEQLQADATMTVAISDYGAAQLRRWARPQDWHKIQVVRCGIREQYFKHAKNMTTNCHRIVCVGRLCQQKGQLLLLDSIKEVHRRGHDCELVLAGDGEMRPIVEERIRTLGLCDSVRVTGWIDEQRVCEEIKAARVLVLPSFAEGLPIVIMEAFAMGRPVISTYVAGIPELVRDNENGWLVPTGNIEQLTNAIIKSLMVSEAQLAKMGRRGAKRVTQLHHAAKQAEHLESLLLSIGNES